MRELLHVHRLQLISALCLAVGLFFLLGAAPALAVECTACHAPGGSAPDGSAHPVPPPPIWDPWDGPCTTCHEIENSTFYQLPPYGAYPIDGAGNPHWEIWEYGLYCGDCHYIEHGKLLSPGVPISGTINLVGSDCAGCHTSGMSYPTDAVAPAYTAQIDPATHGDPTAAHAGMWDGGCDECHGPDVVAEHNNDCTICHPAGGPDPAPGTTCTTCHTTPHANMVSTPASSYWSLALIGVLGLLAVPVLRRRYA